MPQITGQWQRNILYGMPPQLHSSSGTEDLDPVTLGRATEHVYTTFYSPSSHTLCQQSDEILFGCFVIELNAASDQQLSLADEGYESGSDTIDLPTPLGKDSTNSPCFQHGTCFI